MKMMKQPKKIEIKEGREFEISPADKKLLEEFDTNYQTKDGHSYFKILESEKPETDLCRLNDFVVGLIKTSTTIATIKPRHSMFDYKSIMRMWMYVCFDNFANMKTTSGFKSGGKVDDFVRYIISLFKVHLTDSIKRKLPMTYQEKFSWEGSMRGRIEPTLYNLQPVKQKFPVNHDEINVDFVANQYLKRAWEKSMQVLSVVDHD